MSTKSDNVEVEEPERALLFELEFLAVSGWTYLYEALKSVLADKGVKFTLPLFARYFSKKSLLGSLKQMAADFENEALAESETLDAIKALYVESVKSAKDIKPGVADLIKDLRKNDISLGALTCMDQEVVDVILKKLGLSEDDIFIQSLEYCGRTSPSAQDWLRLAKEMQVSVALCTVAATSAASSKAALCAGMRCFALPDKLTAYQDFGGSDYIFDSLDRDAEELVLKLVEAF